MHDVPQCSARLRSSEGGKGALHRGAGRHVACALAQTAVSSQSNRANPCYCRWSTLNKDRSPALLCSPRGIAQGYLLGLVGAFISSDSCYQNGMRRKTSQGSWGMPTFSFSLLFISELVKFWGMIGNYKSDFPESVKTLTVSCLSRIVSGSQLWSLDILLSPDLLNTTSDCDRRPFRGIHSWTMTDIINVAFVVFLRAKAL